ncbi:MAG: branched-chain amino acid ABC transporter permease [Thermoprotei archaeon]|nr:MAG: branched-chain amino acid ABC transporter permease [Thermoprotei archaeon]
MIDLLLDALVYSNLLVLLSISLTLTILTLKVSNFAHGDLAIVGVYGAYTFMVILGISTYFSIPFAFLFGGLYALATYLLVYGPMRRRGANFVMLMIASMAVDISTRSLLHMYADFMKSQLKVYSRGFIFDDISLDITGFKLQGIIFFSSLSVILLLLFLYILLMKTKFGIAMRAAIENPDLAEILGINVEKVYSFSWFLAGGFAGVAGFFLPFRIPTSPDLGFIILLSIFAASILGGVNSLAGAVVGGYIVGFSEILGTYLLSQPPINLNTAYRPAIPFTLLILTLMLMPKGLASLWSKGE